MYFSQLDISKALLSASSLVTLLCTSPAIAQSSSTISFSDTGSHWAAGCIEGVGREGLMKGYLDGSFQPNGTMSRAEFAAVMIKAFPNAPVIRDEPNFLDVSPDFWGWRAIKEAYSKGFLAGYPDNLFRPAQTISRVQALIVIANAQSRPPQQTAAAADAAILSQYFQDANSIPAYARPGIATATRSGLVVNYPENDRLRPNDSITRGEATALLCRINEDGSDARYYVNTLYVAAFGDSFDLDGLATAAKPLEFTLLETLEPGRAYYFFSQPLEVNNRLLFIDQKDAFSDLWQTDGTPVGTQLVYSLERNNGSAVSTINARFVGVSEERVWLYTHPSRTPTAKRAALWVNDFATGITQESADFSPDLAAVLSQARSIYANDYIVEALNEKIPLFIRTEQDTQLWMTDGKSSAGTQQIGTFSAKFRSNIYDQPSQQLLTTDDYMFFVAATQVDTDFFESASLWRTDGTSEGTVPLQTIGKIGYQEAPSVWKNQVFFTATTPDSGKELWVSDGTEQGTQLLKDIYSGSSSSEASVIGYTENEVFILANSPSALELWATKGAPESTRLVKRLGNATQSIDSEIFSSSDGKRLFFNASNTSSDELWVSDGTELGTRPIWVGERYSREAISFKNRFFFSNDTIDGEELWVTNGAASDTYQQADLAPGGIVAPGRCSSSGTRCEPDFYAANSTSPRAFTVLDDHLYFTDAQGRLFRTDGTVGGTALMESPIRRGEVASRLVKLGDLILFSTTDGGLAKLWSIAAGQAPPGHGFNRHTSPGVFAIDYPQDWYVDAYSQDSEGVTQRL